MSAAIWAEHTPQAPFPLKKDQQRILLRCIQMDGVHRLSLLNCLDDHAVDRSECAAAPTAGPFQSEEIVVVLIEDQTRALECEGDVIALSILGRVEPGLISPITSTTAAKSPSTSIRVIGAL